MPVRFVAAPAASNRHHHRCDVALFCGLVERRRRGLQPTLAVMDYFENISGMPGQVADWWEEVKVSETSWGETSALRWLSQQTLPVEVSQWLQEDRFSPEPEQLALFEELGLDTALSGPLGGLGIPWRCDSWSSFDRQFRWDGRPVASGRGQAATCLGAAVRAFFHSGGQNCWVIPMGDPAPLSAPLGARAEALERLLFGPSRDPLWGEAKEWSDLFRVTLPALVNADLEVLTWQGMDHLAHLDDAAIFLLPDIIDICAAEKTPPQPVYPTPGPERFVPCTVDERDPQPTSRRFIEAPSPEVAENALPLWRRMLLHCCERVEANGRTDIQIVQALPRPVRSDADAPAKMLADIEADGALRSRHIQLVWPWLSGPGAFDQPGGLQDPSAVLAGTIALGARQQGAFRSIGHRKLVGGWQLGDDFDPRGPDAPLDAGGVSLIEVHPSGSVLRMRSDRTLDREPSWRQAAVQRLYGLIVRSARLIGSGMVFESSGPELWREVRMQLGWLLDALHRRGALRGQRPADGYQLVCNESNHTQQDLDAGRLMVDLDILPAIPVETISVRLDMRPRRREPLGAEA